MHRVLVEYDGGINSEKEEDIYTQAGYDFGKSEVTCDSGCMMSEPYTRDLAFTYTSIDDARTAAHQIRQVPNVRVRVEFPN